LQQYMDNRGRFIAQVAGSAEESRALLVDLDVLNRPIRVRVGDTLANLAAGTLTAPGAAQSVYSYSFDDSSGTPLFRVDASKPSNDVGAPPVTALSTYFNGLNQLVQESFFGGNTRSFTYAPWGSVASRTLPGSQTATFGFNDAGYMESVTLPGQTPAIISHVLDDAGNRSKTKLNGEERVSRTFDSWNRMASRTAAGDTLGYSYWPNDRLKSLTYPDSKKVVSYEIDGFGHWHEITDWATRKTTYGYLPTGQLHSIDYPNGVKATYNYNDAGAISSFSVSGPGSAVLADLTITPNSLNEPESVDGVWPLPPKLPSANVSLSYTNDTLNAYQGMPLSSGPDGALTQIPKPDGSGDLSTVSYDGIGRVSGVDSTVYGYDVDGLRTSITNGSNSTAFTVSPNFYQDPLLNYGSRSRKLIGANMANTGTAGYVLNAINNRNNSAKCLCMDLTWLLESKSGGATNARYVHGIGPIMEEDKDGNLRYFHTDHSGNTIALTDETGLLSGRYAYSPYGTIRNSSTSKASPFTFAGRFGAVDDGNGLSFMRARYMAPNLMRFTGIDQLEGNRFQPTSQNRFQYGLDRPDLYADPLGLSALPWILGIGGAVVVIGGSVACYFFCSAAATAVAGFLGIGAGAAEIAADIELGSELGSEFGDELSSDFANEESRLIPRQSTPRDTGGLRWRGKGPDPRFVSRQTTNTGMSNNPLGKLKYA
jgi:RHS repeat-associated protein